MSQASHEQPRNADGLTYDEWIKRVDGEIARRLGISVHDLADFLSYDLWAAGTPPVDAAREALENDDLFGYGLQELWGD